MGTPVDLNSIAPAALRNLNKPFQPSNEFVASEGLALALIPAEEIAAIRPRQPMWLFPPDLVHAPQPTVEDVFGRGEPLNRSMKTDPVRGRGRPQERAMPRGPEMTGGPRNASGPIDAVG